MKETIRTASVLEIYNEAIANLTEEKRSLQIKLASLQGTYFIKQKIRRIWNFVWKTILTIIVITTICSPIARIIRFISTLISTFSFYDANRAVGFRTSGPLITFLVSILYLFSMIILAIFLAFLGIKLIKKIFKRKSINSETLNRISRIEKRLSEIKEEIDSRKQRKKSLLEAEEVIASKDLKTEKMSIDDDNPTEKFDANKLSDKICPMCAETVKSAAKVCRFCNHRF